MVSDKVKKTIEKMLSLANLEDKTDKVIKYIKNTRYRNTYKIDSTSLTMNLGFFPDSINSFFNHNDTYIVEFEDGVIAFTPQSEVSTPMFIYREENKNLMFPHSISYNFVDYINYELINENFKNVNVDTIYNGKLYKKIMYNEKYWINKEKANTIVYPYLISLINLKQNKNFLKYLSGLSKEGKRIKDLSIIQVVGKEGKYLVQIFPLWDIDKDVQFKIEIETNLEDFNRTQSFLQSPYMPTVVTLTVVTLLEIVLNKYGIPSPSLIEKNDGIVYSEPIFVDKNVLMDYLEAVNSLDYENITTRFTAIKFRKDTHKTTKIFQSIPDFIYEINLEKRDGELKVSISELDKLPPDSIYDELISRLSLGMFKKQNLGQVKNILKEIYDNFIPNKTKTELKELIEEVRKISKKDINISNALENLYINLVQRIAETINNKIFKIC